MNRLKHQSSASAMGTSLCTCSRAALAASAVAKRCQFEWFMFRTERSEHHGRSVCEIWEQVMCWRQLALAKYPFLGRRGLTDSHCEELLMFSTHISLPALTLVDSRCSGRVGSSRQVYQMEAISR